MSSKSSTLVTGAAGFIGYHIAARLLRENVPVIGYDNVNSYYDPSLKRARLNELNSLSEKCGTPFVFIKSDLEDKRALTACFETYKPDFVINLAAQAGVRYSIENPSAYIQSNVVGFGHLLECCKNYPIKHLIYASSSSVYGGNVKTPFSEHDNVDHPVSLYATTKKTNELMAHSYSHLFGVPTTGLRFFTVYGPWGRPDMALFLFTQAILQDTPIKVFNHGKMIRDFTFVDDIVESLYRLLFKPPGSTLNFDYSAPDPSSSWAPYRVLNIGNSQPTPLMEYIDAIEDCLGIEAKKEFLPMQMGDVAATSADTTELYSLIDFKPSTSVRSGVRQFVDWYRRFYKI